MKILKLLIILIAVAIPVTILTPVASAHKPQAQSTCSIIASNPATGNLTFSGSGFAFSTNYQYQVWSTVPSPAGANNGASVGGGELTTTTSGSFYLDGGYPLSFYMNVYPDEKILTFQVFPIKANKADLSTVLCSASLTP